MPAGDDVPYALDGTHIYVRQEAETHIALRDEIVALVRRKLLMETGPSLELPQIEESGGVTDGVEPPRTGVQIVETAEQKGTLYHTMKDLRNGNIVHNVTRTSARKLWRYAIHEHENNPVREDQVRWQGNLGLWKSSRRAGKVRYDLVQRTPNGQLCVYDGVPADGSDGPGRVHLDE